jgi:hypothetical protein
MIPEARTTIPGSRSGSACVRDGTTVGRERCAVGDERAGPRGTADDAELARIAQDAAAVTE